MNKLGPGVHHMSKIGLMALLPHMSAEYQYIKNESSMKSWYSCCPLWIELFLARYEIILNNNVCKIFSHSLLSKPFLLMNLYFIFHHSVSFTGCTNVWWKQSKRQRNILFNVQQYMCIFRFENLSKSYTQEIRNVINWNWTRP